MKSQKKVKPHVVDAKADIINVLGLESNTVLRKHRNGAKVTRPLSWAEMGLEVRPA